MTGKEVEMVEVGEEMLCLDVWRVPRELGATALPDASPEALAEAERKVLDNYVRRSVGPFKENELTEQAPMTLAEHAAVVAVMVIVMGGALYWSWAGVAVLALGSWEQVGMYAVATLVLALHPLPDVSRSVYRSWLVAATYKYFSYRFLFSTRAKEMARKHQPYIGAGVPHGAMPFANLLSVPAVNAFMYGREFVGAPASVVFHTPFLRYFTLFKSCHVGREALVEQLEQGHNVGLVGDGIAGIFKCSHDDEVVSLKTRKGLAKLALRTGFPVLPCYSVGNTEAFSVFYDRFGIMEHISRKAQASLFFYWGRFGLPIPHRVNITMVVGDMVLVDKVAEPTEAQVDEVHARILSSIERAFNSNKASLGWGHKTMTFV